MKRLLITLTVEMPRDAMREFNAWSEAAEDLGGIMPEWRAGKAFCRWYRKRGIDMRLVKWSISGGERRDA